MGTAFLLRILTIVFNWRTSPLQPLFFDSPEPPGNPPA
jgi:hypothetical protein